MKKYLSLFLCGIIVLMSVGCDNFLSKPADGVSSAKGYVISCFENKYGYYDALFYNSESNEYSKIIINENKVPAYNYEHYIKLNYKEKDGKTIAFNIEPIKSSNLDSFWTPEIDYGNVFYITEFCKFEYSKNQPVDFKNAVEFFINYNATMDYKFLEGKSYIRRDVIEHRYYKKDELLSKVKEFFPTLDKSQIENYVGYKKSPDEWISFEYDKENNLIYTLDGYTLAGAGYYTFVKSYEKQSDGVIKAVITQIDNSNFPIEWTYEYKLNDDNSVQILNVSKECVNVTNAEGKPSYSEYKEYILKIDKPIIDVNWDSPSNIPVEKMLDFFSTSNKYDDYWNIEKLKHIVPFDVVFNYLTNYFDITKDYLKSSKYYNKQSNCFEKVFGNCELNFFDEIEIDNVIENDEIIKIHYYAFARRIYKLDNKIYKDCTLTLQKTDNKIKYKSFKFKDCQQPDLFSKEA